MSRFSFGDRKRVRGRVYEWVEPGWWQMRLTDDERAAIASGMVPREWHPTAEEIEAAKEYAERLLGGTAISQEQNNG